MEKVPHFENQNLSSLIDKEDLWIFNDKENNNLPQSEWHEIIIGNGLPHQNVEQKQWDVIEMQQQDGDSTPNNVSDMMYGNQILRDVAIPKSNRDMGSQSNDNIIQELNEQNVDHKLIIEAENAVGNLSPCSHIDRVVNNLFAHELEYCNFETLP